MKRKMFTVLLAGSLALPLAFGGRVFAQTMPLHAANDTQAMPLEPEPGNHYLVNDLGEFKAAIAQIEADSQFDRYEIHLNADIAYGAGNDSPQINKDVTILGHGHTLNLGTDLNFSMLRVGAGGKLSLGRANPTGDENELTITVTPTQYNNTQQALILIGLRSGAGTLNMYDGVKLTGNIANGSSLASAVNIQNGTFNMYGGEICNNTNYATSGMGGAVAGRTDDGTETINFNMYGGRIHDNVTDSNISSYSAAVLLIGGTFHMYGGEISNNNATRKQNTIYNYGGGVALYQSDGVLEAGRITGNAGSVYGGGVYACAGSSIVIKNGVVISDNSASYGGGLNFNSAGTATIEAGAVLANNIASNGGDDISFYGNAGGTLYLEDAADMQTRLDETGKMITGWYQDALDARWTAETAQVIDVQNALTVERYHLKAAHEQIKTFQPAYEFISGSEGKPLPAEVLALLPTDTLEYDEGTTIQAIDPKETTVKVTQGQWIFKGWDETSKTAADGVTFIGTWVFEESTPPSQGGDQPSDKPSEVDPGEGSTTDPDKTDPGNEPTVNPDKADPTVDNETTDKAPQTAGAADVLLYAALLSLSGIAGLGICAQKRKKENDSKSADHR